MNKHLVVNADDLGIAPEVNRAVAHAHASGPLSSASLMVNMPASEDAVINVIRRHPRLGVGLHVCLTSGVPVAAPRDIPLLVDDQGQFRHSFLGLARLLLSRRRHDARAQISREVDAQWRRATAWGIALDHVNGHQHVHMIGPIYEIVAQLAARNGLVIRIPRESLGTWSRRVAKLATWARTGGLAKSMLLTTMGNLAASPRPRNRPVAFFGVLDTGRMSANCWRHVLASIPAGASEVAVHPAFALQSGPVQGCSPADQSFLASPRRQMELDALLDPRLREEIDRRDILLVRFADIRRGVEDTACVAA